MAESPDSTNAGVKASLEQAGVDLTLIAQGWPEGNRLAAELMEKLHSSDAVAAIEGLIARVETMGLADRFDTQCYPYQRFVRHSSSTLLDKAKST